jgi:hypothetical protein
LPTTGGIAESIAALGWNAAMNLDPNKFSRRSSIIGGS